MDPGQIDFTLAQFDFAKRNGLIVAIIQDSKTKEVLMQAYMTEEALRLTLATGRVWFWKTSENRLWQKGEKSGNHLIWNSMAVDCDGDAILLTVEVRGDGHACHLNRTSCFRK